MQALTLSDPCLENSSFSHLWHMPIPMSVCVHLWPYLLDSTSLSLFSSSSVCLFSNIYRPVYLFSHHTAWLSLRHVPLYADSHFWSRFPQKTLDPSLHLIAPITPNEHQETTLWGTKPHALLIRCVYLLWLSDCGLLSLSPCVLHCCGRTWG